MITKRAFCGVNRVTYRGMVLYSCNPLPWYRHSCNYKLMVQPDPRRPPLQDLRGQNQL